MTATEMPLGPRIARLGKLRVDGDQLVIYIPLTGERRVPVEQLKQVELLKRKWYQKDANKRTITLRGVGGHIATFDAIGKRGDAAYEWLLSLCTSPV